MRRSTHLLLAAGMLAACGTPTPSASPSDDARRGAGAVTDAAHHLDVAAPRDVTTDATGAEPGDPSGSSQSPQMAANPETSAADAVLQLVEDEGLLVLDLNSNLTASTEGAATVEVQVLYGTGRSYPHEETYLVRLLDDAGSWAVTDVEVAP